MRRLNWRNIIEGLGLLAIIAVVIMLMSVDWGEMIL